MAAAACHTNIPVPKAQQAQCLTVQKYCHRAARAKAGSPSPAHTARNPARPQLPQPTLTCAALDAKLSEQSVSAPLPGSGEMLHTSSTLDDPHSESCSTCRNTTAGGCWCLLQFFGAHPTPAQMGQDLQAQD